MRAFPIGERSHPFTMKAVFEVPRSEPADGGRDAPSIRNFNLEAFVFNTDSAKGDEAHASVISVGGMCRSSDVGGFDRVGFC